MGLAERIDARKAWLEAKKRGHVALSKAKWRKREALGKASKGVQK